MSNENTPILILTSILVYGVSYFIIFIDRDPINVLKLDYVTAIMSLIPVMATVVGFKKLEQNFFRK